MLCEGVGVIRPDKLSAPQLIVTLDIRALLRCGGRSAPDEGNKQRSIHLPGSLLQLHVGDAVLGHELVENQNTNHHVHLFHRPERND